MIRLRAIKGKMGTTEYYLTTATMGEVSRIVGYKEDAKEWPPEIRQQRPLNMSRIKKDMVPYLTENDDHFYNALVVEHVRPGDVKHEVRFVPDEGDSSTGWVELQGSETLEALDGQHRLKSIELAVAEKPDLAMESIGLVIVPHRAIGASQQLFSDLNRNAKPTPKSLNIMFEHREGAALLAKDLASKSEYLKGRVLLTGSNLSDRSPYMVTIATLYEAVRIVEPLLPEGDHATKLTKLVEYWDCALAALPGIQDLTQGKMAPSSLRGKYIYATGLGFEALAEVIKAAVTLFPDKWQAVLSSGLSRIPWEIGDTQLWEGVALFGGRIAIARAARRRTATLVKYLLGLTRQDGDDAPDKSNVADLAEAYQSLGKKLPSPLLVPTAV